MSAFLLMPPASEPLTLDEAKQFLRVEHDDDDALIASLIVAARAQVESVARCALIAQTWRFVRDAWPAEGRIVLKHGPLLSVAAARVFDGESEAVAIDIDQFVIDRAGAVIVFAPWALPHPSRRAAGIEIDVVLGFGDEAANIPEPLRQAVRLLLAHWYENRALAGETGGNVPPGFAALLAHYRPVSL